MKYVLPTCIVLTAVVTTFSCKKDKIDPAVQTTYPNYSNLKVGNYWIYETYKVDTSGLETAQLKFDSCYVEMDTTINSNVYFKVVRPTKVWGELNWYFLRDSLHYIVDHKGVRLFSSQDFTNQLAEKMSLSLSGNDTIREETYKMTDRDSVIITPAGSFVTLNYKGFHFYPSFNVHLTWSKRYANNVGIVEEDLGSFMSQPSWHYIRKLIHYHVN